MALRHDPDGAEIRAIKALIPSFRGCRVLEIGCGDGRLTTQYAADARWVVAIDPDESAVAQCRAAVRDLPVDVRAADFAEFSPPRAEFDVVIFSWSL